MDRETLKCANCKHPETMGGEIAERAQSEVLGNSYRESVVEDRILDYIHWGVECIPVRINLRADAYQSLAGLITHYTGLTQDNNGVIAGYATRFEINLIASWASAGVEKLCWNGNYTDKPFCPRYQPDIYADIDHDTDHRATRLRDRNLFDILRGTAIESALVDRIHSGEKCLAVFATFLEQGSEEVRNFVDNKPETLHGYLSRLTGLREVTGDFWDGSHRALRGPCSDDAILLLLSHARRSPNIGIKYIFPCIGYELY